MGNASELSWQVDAGAGYVFNQTWAVEPGYRHLLFEREIDNLTLELDQSGPLIGMNARFREYGIAVSSSE